MGDIKLIMGIMSIILSLISIYLAIKYEIKKNINSIIQLKVEEEKRLISIEEKLNGLVNNYENNQRIFNSRLTRVEKIIFNDFEYK